MRNHRAGSRTLCLTVTLACGMGRLAAQEPKWDEMEKKARASLETGDATGARRLYEASVRTAPTRQAQARAMIGLAGALAKGAGSATEAAEAYERARGALERPADAVPDPAWSELSCLLHNNYGVFLLRNADPRSREVLGAIENEMRQEQYRSQRGRYLYNYARSVELTGERTRALALYLEAVGAEPAFAPAAGAALRLARMPEMGGGAGAVAGLAETLLSGQQLPGAENVLRAALSDDGLRRQAGFSAVVWALVKYLTAASMGAEAYFGGFRTDASGADRDAALRLTQIEDAYTGDFPSVLSPDVSQRWRFQPDEARTFARFLKMTGDWFSRTGRPALAIQRYGLAWSLDREYTEAALYMANVLLDARPVVDPDGRLLREVESRLFEQKGEAYLGNDWPSILRFHTVLGAIFERDGKLGPPESPASATFQWEHALQAQQRLGRSSVDAPGLHEKLGTAYKTLGKPSLSYGHFVTAAEGYAGRKQFTSAATAVEKAETLPVAPPAADRQKLEGVKAVVRANSALLRGAAVVAVPPDPAAASRAQRALAQDPRLGAYKLDVAVKEGVVTLKGSVPEQMHRAEAEKLTREAAGVKRVVNQIEVKEPPN